MAGVGVVRVVRVAMGEGCDNWGEGGIAGKNIEGGDG